MTAPMFSITRNGDPVAEVSIDDDGPVRLQTDIVVNEMQHYGFEWSPRDSSSEYGLWIGDIEAGRAMRADGQPAATLGFGRSRFILWDDAAYFDGARGIVWLRVCTRPTGQDAWHDRALIAVTVTSSKLSRDRYEGMTSQMAGLASGLVLDLVSKMSRSLRVVPTEMRPQVRSSAVELRLLEAMWPTIARCLQQIAHEPAAKLMRRPALSRCWGSERLDSRALLSMARQGISPRDGAIQAPFSAHVSRIAEHTDTTEHRAILGFLQLLETTTRDCQRDVRRHIESIEADRVWRDRSHTHGPSLYVTDDLPRLETLRNRLARSQSLLSQLQRASRMSFLAGVRPRISLELTPVFSSVEPYRRLRHEMLKFLRSGLVLLDEGTDERIKSTSKLYEQWVFLQIVAAFKVAGFQCASQNGVLHSTRRFRFTLDLDRGARVTFTDANGRSVVVRYEPWVMPRPQAEQNRETVYRGIQGTSAWSPDVLIEFLAEDGAVGETSDVEYAVVLDAKYTQRLREHHWRDTAKYLEIRATASGRQVARQQWLAYPGREDAEDSAISMQDSSIEWSATGPSCALDERFVAGLRLTPPTNYVSDMTDGGWITQPEQSVCDFVNGLVAYMGFQPSE